MTTSNSQTITDATADPAFRAQIQGLKDITASLNGEPTAPVVFSTDPGARPSVFLTQGLVCTSYTDWSIRGSDRFARVIVPAVIADGDTLLAFSAFGVPTALQWNTNLTTTLATALRISAGRFCITDSEVSLSSNRIAAAKRDLEVALADGINVHGAMAALVAAKTEDEEGEIQVPVTLHGATTWLPLNQRQIPTYQFFIKQSAIGKHSTTGPDDDRSFYGGVTLEHALGNLLMANPSLCYDDIDNHVEA